MHFVIETPIKARLTNFSQEELDSLTKELSYTNTAAAHLVKRHYNNKYFRINNPDGWKAKLEELKKDVHKTLVFQEDGQYFIRPGSLPHLKAQFTSENKVKYKIGKKMPWNKPLPFTLHPYQEESAVKLPEVRHGNVELCTSAGKSAILLKVCREMGLTAAIVAPSKSIFDELVEKFEYHLGAGNVGKFGDGKKKIGKRITICIGDSLCNVKKDTPEWEFFSNLDMMCVDESHTWGAETLNDICHGVLGNVPYRFFFSGTQTRGDGAEKLLQSIIGKTVCTLPTWEAKEKGYIADHDFTIVEVESSNPNYTTSDALDMKRVHHLNNRNIAAFIAKLANATALASGKQTLVLVEELPQIAMLIKLLKVPFAYAHAEKKKERLEELGLEKVDPKESVEKFNKNEVKVLIGTSCISTGTNIYPTHSTANWVGGSSEIKTKQGTVGRSVRKHNQNPWHHLCVEKLISNIYDFRVHDIQLMNKHTDDRIEYYGDSRSPIRTIRLKN